MPETQPLNIAIIGHRFMGRAHSNGWLQAPRFFELKARPILKVACGRDENATRRFAANWGWEEIQSDWQKVIAREDIDIIDIATPTHLHHDMAVAAAQNGKHIFCEKPFCRTVAECKKAIAAAKKAKVKLFVGHVVRYFHEFEGMKAQIEAGKVGDPGYV